MMGQLTASGSVIICSDSDRKVRDRFSQVFGSPVARTANDLRTGLMSQVLRCLRVNVVTADFQTFMRRCIARIRGSSAGCEETPRR